MKKFFIILVTLIYMYQAAHACSLGTTPFFKINGIISGYYDLMLVSESLQTKLNFPQDKAPQNYLVDEPINFEVDKNLAPFTPEILKNVELDWDFGDKTKGIGLKNSHSYHKPGSYIVSINASSRSHDFEPYLLESVIVNILPEKNYQLPKAVLKVDGQEVQDPFTDIVKSDWSNVSFDASKSTAFSSKIVSSILDFGDQQQSNKVMTQHRYGNDVHSLIVFAILRVEDANGFIADTFVQIADKKLGIENISPLSFNTANFIPDSQKKDEKSAIQIDQNSELIIISMIVLIPLLMIKILKKEKK